MTLTDQLKVTLYMITDLEPDLDVSLRESE